MPSRSYNTTTISDGIGTDTDAAIGECQTPTPSTRGDGLPWDDSDHADEYTQLLLYVVEYCEGIRPATATRAIYGSDIEVPGTKYRRVVRFYDGYNDLFEIDQRPGAKWVYPTPKACQLVAALNRGMHSPKTREGGGSNASILLDTANDRPSSPSRPQSSRSPRDRTRATLSGVSQIGAETLRADILTELARSIKAERESRIVLERTRGSGPEYVTLPYETRFSTPERAQELHARFERAWDQAWSRYGCAVGITLTTDPAKFEDTEEAVKELKATKNRLMARYTYHYGSRPKTLGVDDVTDSGLPHMHLLVFAPALPESEAELSEYLDGWIGRECDVQRFSRDGHGRAPERARQYIRQPISDIETVASMETGEIKALADRIRDPKTEVPKRDRRLWRVAMLWMWGSQVLVSSPSLVVDESGGDGAETDLPYIPCYRFVGVCRYDQLPGYIREAAMHMSRGPLSSRRSVPESPDSSDVGRGTGPPDAGGLSSRTLAKYREHQVNTSDSGEDETDTPLYGMWHGLYTHCGSPTPPSAHWAVHPHSGDFHPIRRVDFRRQIDLHIIDHICKRKPPVCKRQISGADRASTRGIDR